MGYKFQGAATAGNGVVVFAPYFADCVGPMESTTQTFQLPIDRVDRQHGLEVLRRGHRWQRRRRVCAANADCVGLWDPATQTFTCPSIASTISIECVDYKFWGAATDGNGVVVFAPNNADCVGPSGHPTTQTFASTTECVHRPLASTHQHGQPV